MLVLLLVVLAGPALAQPVRRTLEVGQGRPYPTLRDAAAAQRDGDRILVGPGLHQGCAVWTANNLLIEGHGPEKTVIADRPCQGKGLFVTQGNNIAVRNLTLARASVPDRNGAGIRAEGGDLTVENVLFEDNENGILSGPSATARITIRDSKFLRNGICTDYCAHGIYIGVIAALVVERSVFREQNTGHHIKSRARATTVTGSEIDDGTAGTASYLIDLPHGGMITIRGNRMRKGLRTDNPEAAIMIGVDAGHHLPARIVVEDNVFRNDGPKRTAFVENRTQTPVEMRRNRLDGDVEPLRVPTTRDDRR